jgi:hypothetical protein
MLPTTTITSVIIGPFSQLGQAKRRATERFVARDGLRGRRRSGDDKGDPLAGCEYCWADYTSQGTAYQAPPKCYLTISRDSLIIPGNN